MSNSKIYLGANNLGAGKIKLGSSDVSAIYLGTSLLYPLSGPATIPTLVDWVHTTTATSTANYLSTGVCPTINTVFRAVFHANQKVGATTIGFDGGATPTGGASDNDDYRLFNHDSLTRFYFDFNSSRINKTSVSSDSNGYVSITCGNNYITDNIRQSTTNGTAQSVVNTQNVPIYINVSSDVDFQSLEIWENGTLVYNGHAAYLNGDYGVYDSVGGTFTTQTYGGNTMIGPAVQVDCSDCTNWEDCGYSSYSDCECQENGNCMTVSPSTLTFDNSNLTATFTVTSNESWTLTDNCNGPRYELINWTRNCPSFTAVYDGSIDIYAPANPIGDGSDSIWEEWSYSDYVTSKQEFINLCSSVGITMSGMNCDNSGYSMELRPVRTGNRWLSYSISSGSSGTTTVTVTCEATVIPLNATITITSAHNTATINVTKN